jgi:hypothetical protein
MDLHRRLEEASARAWPASFQAEIWTFSLLFFQFDQREYNSSTPSALFHLANVLSSAAVFHTSESCKRRAFLQRLLGLGDPI